MCGLMGAGEESEPKLGTHYWPGNNNALLLAVSDEKIKPLCELVRKLKVEHPRAGLRAFFYIQFHHQALDSYYRALYRKSVTPQKPHP